VHDRSFAVLTCGISEHPERTRVLRRTANVTFTRVCSPRRRWRSL